MNHDHDLARLRTEKHQLEMWVVKKLTERENLGMRDAHDPMAHRIDPIEDAVLVARQRKLAALNDLLGRGD